MPGLTSGGAWAAARSRGTADLGGSVHGRRWLALTVLVLARASMGFQFQSLASAAPFLVRDLAIAYAEVGFLIGLYMLPGIVLALPAGLLGRRFGDKRVVLAGLALMTAGGLLAGFADGYPALLAGRLASGIGAVLLNVLMTKMITDWFAGREIVLAMAALMNAWPIGIGVALLSLGWLAEGAGWHLAFHATAAATLASLCLVALAYRRHPNDDKSGQARGAAIARQEIALVSLVGLMWALYNGAFAVMLGFAPDFLAEQGLSAVEAGFGLGLATWLLVGSVLFGGLVGQRWGRPNVMLLAGVLGWGIGLLLLPALPPLPVLVAIGLVGGLSVGVITALPSEVLRPETRAAGMGIFSQWLYGGVAVLPPLAGWLRDLSGGAGAPLYFAAALLLAIVPALALFRWLQRQAASAAAPA